MKYSKRYIAFTFILALIFVSNFYIYAKDSSTLGAFRGAQIDNTIWSPLVAADVNGTTIRLRIENKEYTSEDEHVYMDENRNIMVPVSMLRDALNSSAHVYNKNELLVEKHSLTADFKLADDNGFVQYKGQFYASLDKLSKLLDMTCSFDTATNTLTMTDKSEGVSTVPTKYDLRERQRVSLIRDQGSYGTCWAFAATSALESALMPEEQLLFSVDHMSMSNSFNVNQYDGGEYTMGMAYLAAWQGPVYDADDPYGDGVTRDDLAAVKHVQQMLIIDGKDYQGIKEAVFKYGGVQTSLYSTIASSKTKTPYYNKQTNSYCYMGQDKPNHDVVIIGWDDNYPKENFNVDLEGDGAFICQNSWGSSFGDNGVFYVSYYDTNVGTHNVVYTDIESADNYDNIYQSSKALWYEIEDGQAFDLLFLDIEMQELNGFELAAKIQETAPDILIIFVSAYESYVYKSFEFRPFRFIPKQQMESMITQALEAAFREIVSRTSEGYIAENQQGIEKIPFRKIVYIWREGKYLYIEKTDATRCKVRSSLKKISEKLPEDEFVWVDRGYLCNLYHVKQIKDNQMVLSTGQQLYIGERRLAQLKHRIMEYWQAGTMNGE